MSDFVAVLKRTLEGLGETSPDMRQKVYDKARNTIAGKLAGMNPPPPAAVADRQRRALEEAILEVERSYNPSGARREPLDELESVLDSLNGLKNQPVIPPKARPVEASRPVTTPTLKPPANSRPVQHAAPAEPMGEEDEFEPLDDDVAETADEPDVADAVPMRGRRNYAGLIAGVLVLLGLAGGGYAAWQNRDALSQLAASVTEEAAQPPAPEPAKTAATAPETQPEPEEAATPPAPSGPTKFTQQLNPDGSEADMGPSATGATVGEGTSVATATAQGGTEAPAATPPAGQPDQTAGTPPVEDPAAPAAAAPTPIPDAPGTTEQAALPVGQKAIFYEERTNSAEGSADPGSIVWSVVQESPGGDLPPEPAIRAEATIPGKDIQLRMTIRRNADQTLPASHIVEMIFLTPQNFDGGGVDNVLRIALKTSEQDAGTPLAGIPAKISDGFFLIALNDSGAEKDANMRLLHDRSWLDVPLVYKSGRRALFTMEKGIPGDKVFDDVLKAWGVQSSG